MKCIGCNLVTRNTVAILPKRKKLRYQLGPPILMPLQHFEANIAAPIYALEGGGKGVQRRAFVDREAKSHCIIANSMRYLSNQQSVLPKSQQNRISEQWGVMATHQTGKSVKNHISEQHDFFLQSHFTKYKNNPDFHSARFASENVGHGNKLCFETSTHHALALLCRNLPESVLE